jgi:hypothetical protein
VHDTMLSVNIYIYHIETRFIEHYILFIEYYLSTISYIHPSVLILVSNNPQYILVIKKTFKFCKFEVIKWKMHQIFRGTIILH